MSELYYVLKYIYLTNISNVVNYNKKNQREKTDQTTIKAKYVTWHVVD